MFLSRRFLLVFFTFGAFLRVSHAFRRGECRSALGMEAGRIPDSAITASSSYEAKSVGPQNARIRQEKNGGAWCPKAQISSEIREYLEVDLVGDHLVTRTETQGRFGNGQGQEYAEAFLVEYWRSSLNRWVVYEDSKRRRILKGNSNTYLVVLQELELPFVASKVRFIPYSEHPRTVCMRVEIYGCPWEENVISYEAPAGDGEILGGNLRDLGYDGTISGRSAEGGLGQLVDGLFGEDFFDPDGDSDSSSRWVGWSNETTAGRPLEIAFEFDSPREFSFAHVHVGNAFTKNVRVFSFVLIYFSLDKTGYGPAPVRIELAPDSSRESARNVSIFLRNRIGRFVKFRFGFAARRILISEISFETAPILGNMTEESLEQYFLQQDSVVETASKIPGGETTDARKEITPAKSPANDARAYVGLIAGSLAVVVLSLACTALLMVRRGRKKVALLRKHAALVSSAAKPIDAKDFKMNAAASAAVVDDSSSARPRPTSETKRNGKVARGKTDGNVYGDASNGEESDSENSSVYHEPCRLLPSTKREHGCLLKKDVPGTGERADFTGVNGFREQVKFGSSYYNLGRIHLPPAMRPPPYEVVNFQMPPAPSENYYAATDIVKTERREQHFTPGKLTPIKIPEGSAPEDSKLVEFPRHGLRIVEKLGEGGFGTVYLCEAEGMVDGNGVCSFHKKRLVVAKSLWRGVAESIKRDFLRESSWLASLKDANLSRVIGVCSLEEPVYVLQEYSDLGELYQFLRLQNNCSEGEENIVSYGCLIYMATQIASGMKYLESLELVHRDLSARNCILGKQYSVKVSDHAMYCGKYENDYYVVDTKAKLPIRWMAWESLLLGKQTSKSDVWSFAVTLWEILTYCDRQPFAELTDEQVVENSNRWYRNDGLARYLPRPPPCPREIYDLMGECWKRQASDRPLFSEIHLFLKRKNLGYVPGTG